MALLWFLIFVWIAYRLVKSSYRVRDNDLLGDILALLVAIPIGAFLALIVGAILGQLAGY